MPLTIKPLTGAWYGDKSTQKPHLQAPTQPTSSLPTGYDWLRSQNYSYERYQVGVDPYRPGTISGGFSNSQAQLLAHWQQNATVPDPPRLTQSILAGATKPRVGNLTLDMIDPMNTLTELTGSTIGLDHPLLGYDGSQGDPMTFLEGKGISPFGTGPTGAPVRLLDYAFAPFIAAADMATGRAAPDRNVYGDFPYKFQQSGAYWTAIANATDDQLKTMAYNIVNAQADAGSNQWLVQELLAQFQNDRNQVTGLSSGNERTDYVAKQWLQSGTAAGELQVMKDQQGAQVGYGAALARFNQYRAQQFQHPAQANILTNIPFVGTQLAQAVDPISAKTEAAWRAMTPEQRRYLLGGAGNVGMISDIGVSLVALPAAGTAAALAKGAGGVASRAYAAYDGLLTASKASMALGLTVAATNWALEAYWPEDLNLGPVTGEGVHDFTQRVDLSRPFSQSVFASEINALGFWSSATFGAGTVIQAGRRAAGSVGERVGGLLGAAGIPHPFGGTPDLIFYSAGLGGSDMARFGAESLGLDATGLQVSGQRLFLSESMNAVRREQLRTFASSIAGHETGTFMDALPIEQRVAIASASLARPLSEASAEVSARIRLMTDARKYAAKGSILSDEAIRMEAAIKRDARSFDDFMARTFVGQYGADFMHSLAGQDTPAALRDWLSNAVTRLGGTPDGLPSAGSHSLEWWHQLTRMVYHYGFDRWAGMLHGASEGAEEAGRISVMSRRHLFRDEADAVLRAREDGPEAQAALLDAHRNKLEFQDWVLHETQQASRARVIEPFVPSFDAWSKHVEDIYETLSVRRKLPDPGSSTAAEPLNAVQRQMEDEGLWTIGYKPVNEQGEFVAAVETRTGQQVQTRWLDYPLSTGDNVELGDRGFVSNKMDAVFRGYRTWRITEYQRSSLFRSLSAKMPDALPAQIDAFHQGVLAISRKYALPPQAVGRISDVPIAGRAFAGLEEDVDSLAAKVFGPGPHYDALGKPIDFGREIGSAYRQAYRLNLTAGLTSHLKANFGPVGAAVALTSDFVYVLWRFGLSFLFKGGELWESAQLNLMRHVDPNLDPYTAALYLRQGAASDPSQIGVEAIGDQMAAGFEQGAAHPIGALGETRDASWSSEKRAAASLSWIARSLPEDAAQLQQRLALHAVAQDFRARALGGEALNVSQHDSIMAELMDMTDENGDFLPGADVGHAQVLMRQLERDQLPPDVQQALIRYPGGAPTADQLRRAAELDAKAAVYRGPSWEAATEEQRLAAYREGIRAGYFPPDKPLALRDEFRTLIDNIANDRVAAAAWRKGLPHPGVGPYSLADPVTGQAVMRDPVFATDREFEIALRSLRSRMGKVHVEIPSAEELAHRTEIAAEAMRAPRPILRSDRVGPQEQMPAGFTLDPAEVYWQGSVGPDGQEGQLGWLDPESTTPEDRGLYHATTAMDALLDTGLKSRMELIQDTAPDDVVAALDKAYNQDGLAPADIQIDLESGKAISPSHNSLANVATQRYLTDSYGGNIVPLATVTRIRNGLTGEDLYVRPPGLGNRVPEGLSATSPDTMVALTTDFNHAETIAERFKFLGHMAKGETTNEDILAHFATYYDNLMGEDDAVLQMGEALGLDVPQHLDPEQQWQWLVDHMKASSGAEQYEVVKNLDHHLLNWARDNDAMDEDNVGAVILTAPWESMAKINPDQVGVLQVGVRPHQPTVLSPEEAIAAAQSSQTGYAIVTFSDGSTTHFTSMGDEQQWHANIAEDINRKAAEGVQPQSVQQVNSSFGNGPEYTDLAGEGQDWRTMPRVGKDLHAHEVNFDSRDVYVLDPRQKAEPLAANEEDLIRQLRQTIDDSGNVIPGFEKRNADLVYELDLLRQQALNPDPVTAMDQIPETPDGISANLEDAIHARVQKEGKLRQWGRTFWDPIPYKTGRQTQLVTQMQRDEFPLVIKGTGLDRMFDELGIPMSKRADWLVQDRDLLDRWHNAMALGTPEEASAAFDRLMAHVPGESPEARQAFNDLYASEDWATVQSMWALNIRSAQEEAFGVHFFGQYRSPLLRSINHPVLGIYPAAWALKTAREWTKFLFDNRMFGVDLRLGMTPAVVLHNLTQAQAVAFAQNSGPGSGDLNTYLDNGPMGSAVFMFNLILPGDWSSIPFPASRTVRELLRGDYDVSQIWQANLNYLGATRDIRLASESAGEAGNVVFGLGNKPDSGEAQGWNDTVLSVAGVPVRKTKATKWVDAPTR